MIQFVLIVGILNVLLGYGLAVYLADRPRGGPAAAKRGEITVSRALTAAPLERVGGTEAIAPLAHDAAARHEQPLPIIDTGPPAPPAVVESLPPAKIDELPPPWQELLAREHMAPRGFAEGVALALRGQLAAYRQDVVAAEESARRVTAEESPEAMAQLVADFRSIHRQWLGALLEGAELLQARRGRLGDAAEGGARLETLLYDQAARMEMLDCRISDIDFQSDVIMGCRRLLVELLDVGAAVHLLRDELTASLAEIALQQRTLRELPYEQRRDALTGWFNRIGLEVLASQPPEGYVSRHAVLIAGDSFGKINERFGTQAGDQTLQALSRFLAELLQGSSLSAESVRLAGTRFLLLLDGLNLAQVTSLAEQIRQSLERATFDFRGTLFGLSARLGITVAELGEPVEKLLGRLAEAIDAAGIAGGNRCALADAIGTQLVAPQTVPAPTRRLTVGDEVELGCELARESAAGGTEPLELAHLHAAPEPAAEVSTSS